LDYGVLCIPINLMIIGKVGHLDILPYFYFAHPNRCISKSMIKVSYLKHL